MHMSHECECDFVCVTLLYCRKFKIPRDIVCFRTLGQPCQQNHTVGNREVKRKMLVGQVFKNYIKSTVFCFLLCLSEVL